MDPDTLLLERWRLHRDADAFAEILSGHTAMVFSTSRRILRTPADAEDVTQECFLELMRARRRIRSLASWLHTVAVRRALDLMRSRKRRVAREGRAAAE